MKLSRLLNNLTLTVIGSTLCFGSALANTAPSLPNTTPSLPSGATLIKQIDANNYAFNDNHVLVTKISGKNFNELGQHYGTLLKTQITQQLQSEEQNTRLNPKGPLTAAVLNNFVNSHDLTDSESQFITGEASATGLSFNELLYMDLSFLFSITDSNTQKVTSTPMCSFIAKQTDSTTIVGRNLDWVKKFHGAGGQGPVVVTVFNLQDGQTHNKVAGIGYLGWFDEATAVNDKGLLAEVNSGQQSVGSTMNSKDAPGLTSHYIDFLMKDSDLSSLQNDVAGTSPNTGYIANIAGPSTSNDTSSMYSIEKGIAQITFQGIAHYSTRSKSRTGSTQTYYDTATTPGLLVSTNSFRIKGWNDFLKNAYLSTTAYPSLDNDTKSKSFHRYNNLMTLATDAQSWNNDADNTMKGILTVPLQQDGAGGATETGLDPTNIDYTYYSVVFNTSSKTLYINDPVSKNGWTTLDAKILFN